jgi:hypothetical protein
VFTWAFFLAPAALIVSLLWRPKELLRPLPRLASERMGWLGLLVVAAAWIGIAIVPQRELANNVAVERLMAASQTRPALDFMASRQPGDFAPARPLPPKPFEREVFTQLPACFGVVQANDPPWVRALLLSKLDAMMSHMGPRWSRRATDSSLSRAERIKTIQEGIQWHGPDGEGLKQLLDGLQRLPEGQAWLATNDVFVEAIWETVPVPRIVLNQNQKSKSEADQQSDWLILSNQLSARFLTNALARTNTPAPK